MIYSSWAISQDTIPSDLRIWIHEHLSNNILERGELADQFDQAWRTMLGSNSAGSKDREQTDGKAPWKGVGLKALFTCEQSGHLARDCHKAILRGQNRPS